MKMRGGEISAINKKKFVDKAIQLYNVIDKNKKTNGEKIIHYSDDWTGLRFNEQKMEQIIILFHEIKKLIALELGREIDFGGLINEGVSLLTHHQRDSNNYKERILGIMLNTMIAAENIVHPMKNGKPDIIYGTNQYKIYEKAGKYMIYYLLIAGGVKVVEYSEKTKQFHREIYNNNEMLFYVTHDDNSQIDNDYLPLIQEYLRPTFNHPRAQETTHTPTSDYHSHTQETTHTPTSDAESHTQENTDIPTSDAESHTQENTDIPESDYQSHTHGTTQRHKKFNFRKMFKIFARRSSKRRPSTSLASRMNES